MDKIGTRNDNVGVINMTYGLWPLSVVRMWERIRLQLRSPKML